VEINFLSKNSSIFTKKFNMENCAKFSNLQENPGEFAQKSFVNQQGSCFNFRFFDLAKCFLNAEPFIP
jgi:hypothetical protein